MQISARVVRFFSAPIFPHRKTSAILEPDNTDGNWKSNCFQNDRTGRTQKPEGFIALVRPDGERVMGIEPTRPAWKAGTLPLSYTRVGRRGTIWRTRFWKTRPWPCRGFEGSHREGSGSKDFGSFYIGQVPKRGKAITEADILLFAAVSLDTNPVHMNEEAAKSSLFGTRIAQRMLSASLFSALLGTRLPDLATMYMGQSLRFRAPMKHGDTMIATVKMTALIVIGGEAGVQVPSRG